MYIQLSLISERQFSPFLKENEGKKTGCNKDNSTFSGLTQTQKMHYLQSCTATVKNTPRLLHMYKSQVHCHTGRNITVFHVFSNINPEKYQADPSLLAILMPQYFHMETKVIWMRLFLSLFHSFNFCLSYRNKTCTYSSWSTLCHNNVEVEP